MYAWQKWLSDEVAAAADCGFKAMCRCLSEPVYLWYRPGGTTRGALATSHEKPGEQWQLADTDPLPTDLPYSGLRAWIDERAGRLPILGPPPGA